MTATKKSTIAVVDNNPSVLESLQNLLESAGYGVLLFSSAPAFLDASWLSAVDCLISDIGMPLVDGFELRRLANRARPNLPVFLITGRHEISKEQRSSEEVHQRFFQKPFDGGELLMAVSNALEGRH
jgi:FixJ family two-component response regulator